MVQRATELCAQGTCGFSDCLIVAKNTQLGCDFTASFDRAMRKLPGTRVL
jgi:predicted nucleic-acid-binding protein